MTKNEFKTVDGKMIYEFIADDGKTFYQANGVHIGPLFYAFSKGYIIEAEYDAF